jgi:hypothetical protein
LPDPVGGGITPIRPSIEAEGLYAGGELDRDVDIEAIDAIDRVVELLLWCHLVEGHNLELEIVSGRRRLCGTSERNDQPKRCAEDWQATELR